MALMSSFYGGRRGASFIIAKSYLDVLCMTEDFAKGNDFTEVRFDEYVIINNPYKNHPDNGKIFRRGYDFDSDRILSSISVLVDSSNQIYSVEVLSSKYLNENGNKIQETDSFKTIEELNDIQRENEIDNVSTVLAHGAEYIGTIIGPSGSAPLLSVTSYEDAENKSTSNTNFGYRTTSGEYSPNSLNPGLIPGKDQNGYNDSIQWYCTSIRNDNYEDDTQAYIGFKFPYLVTQMQTSWVEPYMEGSYADTSSIQRILEENETINTHPYYNKWHLNIPKGIKGDTFKNLKVLSYQEWLASLENSDERILYNALNNEIYQPDSNKEEDLIRKLLIYEDWNYDNKQSGQVKYYYLGNYNQISDVDLENGILTFSFTYDDDKVFEMEYPISIAMNNDGKITITYSTIEENGQHKQVIINSENPIKWITSIEIGYQDIIVEGGSSQINDGQQIDGEQDETIQYTERVYNEGSFIINYNTGERTQFSIPWVNSIIYDEDSGELKYTLAGEQDAQPKSIGTFIGIQDIVQDTENGSIKIILSSQVEGSKQKNFPLRLVKNISIEKNIEIPVYEKDSITGEYLKNEQGGYIQKEQNGVLLTENVSGLIVTYAGGDKELISTNFDFLESFNFDQETSSFYYKKFSDEENTDPTQVPVVYPVGLEYNQTENVLKYNLSNGTQKTANDFPIITGIEMGNDLKIKVEVMGHADNLPVLSNQMTEEEDSNGVVRTKYTIGTVFNSDTAQSFFQNLFGIKKTFTPSQIKDSIQASPGYEAGYENYVNIYNILQNKISGIESSESSATLQSILTEALNLLYPSGTVGNNDDTEALILIAIGEEDSIKSIFAYNHDKKRPVEITQTVIDEQTGETVIDEQTGQAVTETKEIYYGSWFFLGAISDQGTIIKVGDTTDNLPSTGGILITTKTDMCPIEFSNINKDYITNPITEIKLGSKYQTKITDPNLNLSQIEIYNGDIKETTAYDSSTQIITIDIVQGSVSITKITPGG